MTPVLIAVIAAVAVVLTVVSARRGVAERDAVERHHRTLDALGNLTTRAATPPAPPGEPTPPRDAQPSPPHPDPVAQPGVAQPGVAQPGVARPTPPFDTRAIPSLAPGTPAPVIWARGDYRPRHRKSRVAPNRIRAAGVVGVASLVVLVLGAGGYLVVRSRGGAGSSQAQHRPAPTTTLAAARPTPTSALEGSPVMLVSSDTVQARYRVSRPSVDVELVPTALCWIEMKSALGHGPVLFSGTLRPGARRAVPTGADQGGVSVLLGNPPGMSVSVNGTVLAFPRPSGAQPFTLLFQPPG